LSGARVCLFANTFLDIILTNLPAAAIRLGAQMMKAAICTGYGSADVVRIVDVPKPVAGDDEILIRARATTVTSGDWRIRSLEMPPGFGQIARLIFGITKPRQPILGSEVAGEVEAVGKDVSKFRVGDRVVAFDGSGLRCHAEFKCIRESGNVVRIPDQMDFTTAAALPFGGTTAMDFLRRVGLTAGEKILVVGASGSVGSAAVQLARHRGAQVTGVCSTANVEIVSSLGAERVIDYGKEDVTSLDPDFDVVMETVGALNLTQSLRLLRSGGRAAMIAGSLSDMLTASWKSKSRGLKAVVGPAAEKHEDLQEIVTLAAEGIFRPFIEHTYAFEQIAEAHRRVQQRRKRGNLVITLT